MQSSMVVGQQRHEKQTEPLRQLDIAGQELLRIPLEQRYYLWTRQRSRTLQYVIPPSDDQNPVYLFNVLVAMEWEPTFEERQQLAKAFRLASKFLYNVTDSRMALGQVVIGGQALMACADIQLMASNRFNPRSWVDGLGNPIKYTPIRVGRGIWQKNERTTLAWDEEKSFRTLVHEWAHYALGLKDEYLKSKPVVPAHALDSKHGSKHRLVDKATAYQKTSAYQVAVGETIVDSSETIIIPTIGVPNGSLMESVEGNELVPLATADRVERYAQVWDKLEARYPEAERSGRPILDQLDPPLEPTIFFLEQEHAQLRLELWEPKQQTNRSQANVLLLPPENINAEHCWIYVVKGDLATRPEQIIAQGTFDAASARAGFKLLNAEVNDWLVLIGNDQDWNQIVLTGQIYAVEPRRQPSEAEAIVEWTNVTPSLFPVVDVVSLPCKAEEVTSQIQVHIRNAAQPANVWLFPLGQQLGSHELMSAEYASGSWMSQECAIASLDGHVLMRWNDGSMSICTFSQGGGPATHVAARYSPTTAGSAEGNVMIFFKDTKESTSNARVVTTLLHGNFGAQQGAIEPRSYVFSLTSTERLPVDLDPTLIMYFDSSAPKADGDLIIHRLGEDGWNPMPTYVSSSSESSFAAMPMNDVTAANLLDRGNGSLIEHYRIFWVPGDGSAAATAS